MTENLIGTFGKKSDSQSTRKLCRQRWSVDDLDIMHTVFPRFGPVVTAERLGRSVQATKLKAWGLGVVYEDNPRFWSPAEVAILRRDYPFLGPDSVAKALNRGPTAVRVKASQLRIKFDNPSLWSDADIAYLRDRYPTDGPKAVSAALGRSFIAVTSYASVHGIRWINENQWTKADDAFLAVNYSRLGGERCAVQLGRSINAVQMRVHRAGIIPEQDRHWSDEQNQRLREVFRDTSPADLEQEFYRDYRAVSAQARKLGVFRPERLGETRRLLDGTPLSAYWLGFLLADGNFGRGYVQCGLATKDRDHLEKLAKFFGDCRVREAKESCSISIGDKVGVAEVMERFGIVPQKTYQPPPPDRLANLGPDGLVALLLGFFDGDGCTSYRTIRGGQQGLAMARIVCHANWIDLFTWWNRLASDHLAVATRAPFTSSRNFANPDGAVRTSLQTHWYISVAMMRALKRFADQYDLPVLERKWRFSGEASLATATLVGAAPSPTTPTTYARPARESSPRHKQPFQLQLL